MSGADWSDLMGKVKKVRDHVMKKKLEIDMI